MKNIIILAAILFIGCKEKSKRSVVEKSESTTVITENYELVKSSNSKALLILFPGGASTSKEI